MSRFLKEQVSVEEITEAFVVDIAELANKSFDKWYDEFVGAANMLENRPYSRVHFQPAIPLLITQHVVGFTDVFVLSFS